MRSISRKEAAGFARIDLIFLLVTLGLLLGLFAPAFGKSQVGSRFIECLANKRRLMAAWSAYTSDNGGLMPGSYTGGDGFPQSTVPPYQTWVSGWIDWDTRTDTTNTLFLTDKRYSALAPYLAGNTSAFKCPADVYQSPLQSRLKHQRVRSVSANIAVGVSNVDQTGGLLEDFYRTCTNTAQFGPQSPSQIWVYADEHPDSINDPAMYPPRPTEWLDLPSTLHDRGGAFSFADGHGEVHHWTSARMAIPVRYSFPFLGTDVAMRDDIAWVRNRTPHR